MNLPVNSWAESFLSNFVSYVYAEKWYPFYCPFSLFVSLFTSSFLSPFFSSPIPTPSLSFSSLTHQAPGSHLWSSPLRNRQSRTWTEGSGGLSTRLSLCSEASPHCSTYPRTHWPEGGLVNGTQVSAISVDTPQVYHHSFLISYGCYGFDPACSISTRMLFFKTLFF